MLATAFRVAFNLTALPAGIGVGGRRRRAGGEAHSFRFEFQVAESAYFIVFRAPFALYYLKRGSLRRAPPAPREPAAPCPLLY